MITQAENFNKRKRYEMEEENKLGSIHVWLWIHPSPSLDHGLLSYPSKEVKLNAKLSCGDYVCYVSSVVI